MQIWDAEGCVRALERETVLITGAGRGIGEAIAHAFARVRKNLVLLARNGIEVRRVAEAVERRSVQALPVAADVSRCAEVRQAVSAALDTFGRIDVLVNCAGVYGPIGALVDNDMEAWAEAIQINLVGTALCMHEVLPHMIARRGGVIVNFSGGGAVAGFPRFSAYGASKAAVVRLTETVAEEVKEFGIRVNAIAPGAVNTRLLDQVLSAGEQAGREFYAKALEQKQKGGVPPEKAAELAVFLASPAAAGVTGRLISAVWDDWKSLPSKLAELNGSALFTLRRIDGRQFQEVR